jgi:hypothetical protein
MQLEKVNVVGAETAQATFHRPDEMDLSTRASVSSRLRDSFLQSPSQIRLQVCQELPMRRDLGGN